MPVEMTLLWFWIVNVSLMLVLAVAVLAVHRSMSRVVDGLRMRIERLEAAAREKGVDSGIRLC